MTVRTPSDRVCLTFVATLGDRLTEAPSEHLARTRDLDKWLRDHGLAGARAAVTDLVRARELREAIHALVTAAIDLRSPDPADLTVVRHAAALAPTSDLLWRGRELRTSDRHRPVSALLGVIATDVMNLLTGPDRGRLRQCEAEGCTTPFLSHDGGRPRRWCSSAICGNRARVSAHRARARAGVSK